MGRLVECTWSKCYYEEQFNGMWRNMGHNPQDRPIDTIEYSIRLSDLKGGRFRLAREASSKLLLII